MTDYVDLHCTIAVEFLFDVAIGLLECPMWCKDYFWPQAQCFVLRIQTIVCMVYPNIFFFGGGGFLGVFGLMHKLRGERTPPPLPTPLLVHFSALWEGAISFEGYLPSAMHHASGNLVPKPHHP